MSETNEPEDKEPSNAAAAVDSSSTKPANSALASISRILTEDELSSTGARKLIIDRLDTAEKTIVNLKEYETKYHDSNIKVAVLTAQSKHEDTFEILYGAVLVIGSLIAGLCPNIWDKQPYGWLALLSGIALILGATGAKVVRRWK